MNDDQTQNRLLLDEYEIQHFGFSSSYFISEFKNAVIYTIKSIHEEMGSCIERKLELSDEEKNILHTAILTLTQRYVKETEICLSKNEEKVRNFFSIPPNILLKEDNIQAETADINEQDILIEIEKLKLLYLKEKSLSFLYEEEIRHIDRTIKLQEQVSKLLKQIDNFSDSNKSIKKFNKLNNLYEDLIQKFENHFDSNLNNKLLLSVLTG